MHLKPDAVSARGCPTPTLDDTKAKVRALGDTIQPGDAERHLSLIRDLAEPARVLQLLREIMASDDVLEQLAARSYRHVSHFDKIVIVEAEIPNGYRLTAHMWDPPYTEAELNDELIHDHRFSFWSAILTGALTSRVFTPDPEGTEFRRYQYTPENASAENFYAFHGACRLRASDLKVEEAGQAYYLSYDTTHKVILPLATLACTLVLRSPRARTFSNVYNTVYPTTDASVSNVMFTEAELFSRLARLYAAIEATRVPRAAMVRQARPVVPVP